MKKNYSSRIKTIGGKRKNIKHRGGIISPPKGVDPNIWNMYMGRQLEQKNNERNEVDPNNFNETREQEQAETLSELRKNLEKNENENYYNNNNNNNRGNIKGKLFKKYGIANVNIPKEELNIEKKKGKIEKQKQFEEKIEKEAEELGIETQKAYERETKKMEQRRREKEKSKELEKKQQMEKKRNINKPIGNVELKKALSEKEKKAYKEKKKKNYGSNINTLTEVWEKVENKKNLIKIRRKVDKLIKDIETNQEHIKKESARKRLLNRAHELREEVSKEIEEIKEGEKIEKLSKLETKFEDLGIKSGKNKEELEEEFNKLQELMNAPSVHLNENNKLKLFNTAIKSNSTNELKNRLKKLAPENKEMKNIKERFEKLRDPEVRKLNKRLKELKKEPTKKIQTVFKTLLSPVALKAQ